MAIQFRVLVAATIAEVETFLQTIGDKPLEVVWFGRDPASDPMRIVLIVRVITP